MASKIKKGKVHFHYMNPDTGTQCSDEWTYKAKSVSDYGRNPHLELLWVKKAGEKKRYHCNNVYKEFSPFDIKSFIAHSVVDDIMLKSIYKGVIVRERKNREQKRKEALRMKYPTLDSLLSDLRISESTMDVIGKLSKNIIEDPKNWDQLAVNAALTINNIKPDGVLRLVELMKLHRLVDERVSRKFVAVIKGN